MRKKLNVSKYDTNFNVVFVNKHIAKKEHIYYDGEIKPGQSYYRGFAINKETKSYFEFMFKDDSYYENESIPSNILEKEYIIYWSKRRNINH